MLYRGQSFALLQSVRVCVSSVHTLITMMAELSQKHCLDFFALRWAIADPGVWRGGGYVAQ